MNPVRLRQQVRCCRVQKKTGCQGEEKGKPPWGRQKCDGKNRASDRRNGVGAEEDEDALQASPEGAFPTLAGVCVMAVAVGSNAPRLRLPPALDLVDVLVAPAEVAQEFAPGVDTS